MAVKNRCYRFGEVEINVQNMRVTTEIRPLEPKSSRLLLFLVENPGRVLLKDEIIMAVFWPDAFVSDNSLARAITQIRKALDGDPKTPRGGWRTLSRVEPRWKAALLGRARQPHDGGDHHGDGRDAAAGSTGCAVPDTHLWRRVGREYRREATRRILRRTFPDQYHPGQRRHTHHPSPELEAQVIKAI